MLKDVTPKERLYLNLLAIFFFLEFTDIKDFFFCLMCMNVIWFCAFDLERKKKKITKLYKLSIKIKFILPLECLLLFVNFLL